MSPHLMENIDELVRRIQPYFEELTAKDFMMAPAVTVRESQLVLYAKEMMRLRRISGLPVVDDQDRIAGVISIEDIIHALESGDLRVPISEKMTKNIICLSKNERITDIVRKFELYNFGRFPVVDGDRHVIGIVTKHDLMTILLEKLSILYVHDARREPFVNTENFRSIPTRETLTEENVEFEFEINYMEISLAGTGAAKLKKFLLSKGFSPKFVKRVAIAAYEAETNVVIHSNSSGTIKAYIEPETLIVRVSDNGKGIENVEQAMKEGFSTAPDYVREMGFGAGMGLPNIKRCADKMMILSSPGQGVLVEMLFWRHENEDC